MKKKEEIENLFIRTYSDIHEELTILEKEIEYHISNKTDILCDDYKIKDLKKRTIEVIELLNKTRENERKIFLHVSSQKGLRPFEQVFDPG